jgi:hypothetical protein
MRSTTSETHIERCGRRVIRPSLVIFLAVWVVLTRVGLRSLQTGNLAESMQCYKSALALKHDHPHAYNNLGNSLKDKGLIKEAVHCYTTAIRCVVACCGGAVLVASCVLCSRFQRSACRADSCRTSPRRTQTWRPS